jgi:CrcB protein
VSPLAWVAFVTASAAGASARYLLDGLVTERAAGAFHWGTFVINISGSFILGLLTGLGLHHGLPRVPRVVLGTGFCGAYTTFSTFTFQTVRLLEGGASSDAVHYAFGTLIAGACAGAAGLALATL